jgi:succinate dehydrogenase/fumarate reductase flavoprotein subunit
MKELLSMGEHMRWPEPGSSSEWEVHREADVLVLGGGPAGTWAAWNAASAGARVVLADKGYCGTSGAALSGVTHWYVEPDRRDAAIASRSETTGGLHENRWMARVLDQTYRNLNMMAEWDFPFPMDDQGRPYRKTLQGPEYLKLMRRQVLRAKVDILDHSPALELLVDDDGAVAGAAGFRRQTGERWAVRASAVVIATGGCAFLSNAVGCNVLTGDGYLLAAEAGADLSGMEFSNVYGISAAFASVTKRGGFEYATFYTADKRPIDGANAGQNGTGKRVIGRALLEGPVYARLDRASDEERSWYRQAQPNFFLPYDRRGIDPFTQFFPITLRSEGTVRGTSGIRIVDDSCATSVSGLYAAGDAATRELLVGGSSGGGSGNAAWAMSSGTWAGRGAAAHARVLGSASARRTVRGIGQAGLRPAASAGTLKAADVVAQVQAEILPYDRNLFRRGDRLEKSLSSLHSLWSDIRADLAPEGAAIVRARESAAMVATARWMYTAALARTESRGVHIREDHTLTDPLQQRRQVVNGLDQIHLSTEQSMHASA